MNRREDITWTKKAAKYKGGDDKYCSRCIRSDPKNLWRRSRRAGKQRKDGDHPNSCIVEIGQYTENRPGYLQRLAVTQWVLQNRIINCLKMYKISNEIINFIAKIMKIYKMEMTAGGRSLSEAKVKKGIFQGDSLSPLQFMIAMMPQPDANFVHRRKGSIPSCTRTVSNCVQEWKRTGNSNTCSQTIQSGLGWNSE